MIKITQIPADEQQKILKKKLSDRCKYQLLTDSGNEDYKENRVLIYNLCKNDFKFWCDNFVWIQDPEAEDINKKDIPFLLYKYQEEAADEIIKAIEKGYDLPIEKSRKMGMSWLLMAILVYVWHFKQYDSLCGSQTKAKVDKKGDMDSLFEKARYIISRQPSWMMPKIQDKIHDKNLLLIHPNHKATISGESNNVNFGRAGRRKVILFDEFSSWEQTDRAAWQSCGSVTKCRIPLSTPNTRGTNCHYFTILNDYKNKNKKFLRLHWSLNPIFAEGLYYDEAGKPRSPWYDRECERATSMQEVYQELDIDYEASMAGKVFANFKVEKNVVEGLEYDEDLPLYIAWDFGLDTTAILFIQVDNKNNTINIIDEYVNSGSGGGVDIYHYINVIESKGYKNAVHYGDPHSGENRALQARGGSSNASILRRYGWVVRTERAKIRERVGAAQNIIDRVRVSNKCVLAYEMFISWQFVKPKTGNTSSGVPDHSEHSHIGEAFTYFAINYRNKNKNIKKQKKNYSASISGVMG